MPVPKETNLFGLTLVEARTKGKLDTLILDDFGRLRIVDPNGRYAWSSTDHFGGTTTFYETKKKKDIVYRGSESPPWRVYIPGRVLVRNPGGDGTSEVLVNRNHSITMNASRARAYDKGEIHSLVWDDNAFVPDWKTREINGYISDFQVRDVDNDGEEELVVGVVNYTGMFSTKDTSNIYFFKLQ